MFMMRDQYSLPTVFHVTHHKAGSQWVAEILKHAAPDRVVLPKQGTHLNDSPLRQGGLYVALYWPKIDFDIATMSLQGKRRIVVVIRDLRDTLISLYFSLRYSHITNTAYLYRARHVLSQLNLEDGLLAMIGQRECLSYSDEEWQLHRDVADDMIRGMNDAEFMTLLGKAIWKKAYIQRSWLSAQGIMLVRYEELIQDEQAVFANIAAHCQLNITSECLSQFVANNSFTSVTGRQRGQENIMVHLRKGIVGDWRNYFTDRVKDVFKQQFGDVLILTDYEQDMHW